MLSGYESYDEPMSTYMLEYICDRSQSHPLINRRKARYKICDSLKQWKSEWKGVLLSTQNMSKGLHKVFKTVVNEISKNNCQFWVNLAQKFLTSLQNLKTF